MVGFEGFQYKSHGTNFPDLPSHVLKHSHTQEPQCMHNLDQKAGDWGASVMVRLVRHDQSSTGIHQSLEGQGHRPRERRCCGPGPAAHFLYWLEDPIAQ